MKRGVYELKIEKRDLPEKFLTFNGFSASAEDNSVFEKTLIGIEIIWIRHGEFQLIDSKEKFPDSDEQVVLTEKSIEKAKRLGHFINSIIPSTVFCSPLTRTRQTAEALLETSKIHTISYEKDLREVFPEELSGLSLVDANAKYGEGFIAKMFSNPLKLNFPNSESILEGAERIYNAVLRIASTSGPTNQRYIVGHSVAHNLFILKAVGGDFSLTHNSFKLDYLNYSVFYIRPDTQTIIIQSLNKKIDSR